MDDLNRRIIWIDNCKAFAIGLVICGHILVSTNSSNSHLDNMAMVMIYSFHMPLFFILSGLMFKRTRLFECIKKKFTRLMIPYSFFCFFALLFYVSFYKLTDHDGLIKYLNAFTKDKILDSILMNSSSAFSGYWFLPVLFTASIILTIILELNNSVFEFLIMLIGVLVSVKLRANNIELPLGIGEALLAVPFMNIGFSEKKAGFKSLNSSKLLIISILGYICAIAYWKGMNYEMVDMHNSEIKDVFAFYILGLCGSYISMFFIKWITGIISSDTIIMKCCKFIGEKSIYIYGFHYFFLEIWARIIFKNQLIGNRFEIIILRLIAFVGTLLGCSLLIIIGDAFYSRKSFRRI